MVHELMSQPSIVLQQIPVGRPQRLGDLLGYAEHLEKLVVRYVGQLLAVVLGDDEGVTSREWGNVQEGVGCGGFVEG